MNLYRKLPVRTFFNFGSILINKGIGLVYPLLLIPYLINTVGLSNYGKIAFLQSLVIYAVLIVDYGFNLFCIRLVVKHINEQQIISKIFFHVTIVKLLLTFGITILLVVCLFATSASHTDYMFFLPGLLIVIGQSYLPVWLFQAKQENYKLAGSSLLSKAIATILILTFVKELNDYIMIPLYLGLGEMASFIIFSWKLFAGFIHFSFDRTYFKFLMQEAKSIFISNLSIASYTNLTTIIASVFFTSDLVGIYAIGEKVANLSRAFIAVLIQYCYPKACELVHRSKEMYKGFIFKLVKYFLPVAIFTFLIMFFFSNEMAAYFSKVKTSQISEIIRIFSVLPLSIFCLNLIPYLTLSAYGEDKEVSTVIIYSSAIGLIMLFVLCLTFGIKGIALSVVLTEALVGSWLWYISIKKDYWPFLLIKIR